MGRMEGKEGGWGMGKRKRGMKEAEEGHYRYNYKNNPEQYHE